MKFVYSFFTALLLLFFVMPVYVFAGASNIPTSQTTQQQIFQQFNAAQKGAGIEGKAPDIRIVISRIIKNVLGFVGIILVVIVIYAGFLWMTAGGKEDQVGKAKKWLMNAAIGLVIVLSAYGITIFVTNAIVASLNPDPCVGGNIEDCLKYYIK